MIIPKIKDALELHGYQVETNVGHSDFKVDLAVVDKNNREKYLAAIQVDGHRYASFTATRDRIKLGETMLRKLGWHTIKVWSVEWWHNEEKQIDDLLAQLYEIEKLPRDTEHLKKAPAMRKDKESNTG